MTFPMQPIAVVRSPFKEKFATPRQPGLTPSIEASIDFIPEFCPLEAVRELDGFSHIWLIFLFHQNADRGWTPTVRPPRLGGNQRIGVYASRSPFRPNPIGLSPVRLIRIDQRGRDISLIVEGPDLIDQTPILDIKPYIPYSDSFPEATGGFAKEAPEQMDVSFSAEAEQQLSAFKSNDPRLEGMLREVLALDPRPAYKRDQDSEREYGAKLSSYQVRWRVDEGTVIVLDIQAANNPGPDHQTPGK